MVKSHRFSQSEVSSLGALCGVHVRPVTVLLLVPTPAFAAAINYVV
jgi:hypothetical protein